MFGVNAFSSMRPPLLLLIEDEPDLRELLTAFLEANGLHVLACATAEEGLRALEQVPPVRFDACLTDLDLPGLSGWQFIARAQRLAPDLPILIHSCRDPETTAEARALPGVKGYLRKPTSPETLLQALRSFLA